ncbi:MAG: type 1 glutamine amidotransferase domain-containing protein [Gemmatimonadaceae bacterium]|nr:type 1 glutamine amidotransferase domain-containing protein [Gemmatimonadaceae bacterium]
MRHPILASLAAVSLALAPIATVAQGAPARTNTVLLVISGAGRDSGRTQPGYEMDELAQAYLAFTRNGFAVAIASPQGGAVVADRYDPKSDYNVDFLADTAAVAKLADTRRTAGLRARDYDALMVIGGKGAMFDLPRDTALARLAAELHERGGVVSAVCHGPAGLLAARTRDGRPLVAGRAFTGFTNEEATIFDKQWRARFPYLLEDEARRLGARWEESPLMLPHVAVDDRLITGQNPFATPLAAEAVVRALGRTPVARTPWRDEHAVRTAASLLAADPVVARRTLAAQWKELQIEYIGLLGYYQLQGAASEADVRRALLLMELAGPYMPNPKLTLALAQAYAKLGRAEEARALARDVAAHHKAHEGEARALLASLSR